MGAHSLRTYSLGPQTTDFGFDMPLGARGGGLLSRSSKYFFGDDKPKAGGLQWGPPAWGELKPPILDLGFDRTGVLQSGGPRS